MRPNYRVVLYSLISTKRTLFLGHINDSSGSFATKLDIRILCTDFHYRVQADFVFLDLGKIRNTLSELTLDALCTIFKLYVYKLGLTSNGTH